MTDRPPKTSGETHYHMRPWLVMLLIAWALPVLACNYPRIKTNLSEVSGQEIRQTLKKQLPTLTPAVNPSPFAIQPATILPSPTADLHTATPVSPTPLPSQVLSHPDSPLPDSEVIFSPSTVDFQVDEFIQAAGGYLSSYSETVDDETLTGAQIVLRAAQETSINPRLLLALLEYRSHWVYDQSVDQRTLEHPIGFFAPDYKGLYKELALTGKHLNIGYYGWLAGTYTWLTFPDETQLHINPELNAGWVALQVLFSKLYNPEPWTKALYGPQSFFVVFQKMFGDPWKRASLVEPVIPPGLTSPEMELPFAPGEPWALTAGPHTSWNSGTPDGAIDFAPITGEAPCVISRAWVTASAPGVITRSEHGVVTLDLNGDGYEQTGWVLMYLHIADQDRIPLGTRVLTNDRIGHPSCETGVATGTHVHIARKYNGEWVSADGLLPWKLSGWQVIAGDKPYKGTLRKGTQVITANINAPKTSIVIR